VPFERTEAETIETPVLERPAAAPSGERRQVTIFFADLSGYTQLSDALDAEDLHILVGRVFDSIDRIVEEHGGTVHRHIGDEVMALFGAPVAHADDPLRAVRTAFETHKAMADLGVEEGQELAVHIGIASGEVVVAEQGEEHPQDVPRYAVTGVAANLASRLNDEAGAGETIISNAVYRTVEEQVDCDPLGEVRVKGLDKPVLAWWVKALRPQGAHRGRSPFVGRRTELSLLSSVLDACTNTGNGKAIVVRGEAGIGKTRLVEELEAFATNKGFACHKSIVLDFGVGAGQDAIQALVRSLLGVSYSGDEAARAAAAEQALADCLFDPAQEVFVNDLMDLAQPAELHALYDAMDNATRNRGKQALVAGLIERLSASRRLLVAVEDIQWADPLTLVHLAQITMTVQDCAAVLVMTSRIEGDPLDQAWRGSTGGSPVMTFDLGPLREAEAIELAKGFADAAVDFARSCIERAEGNPLFLEQLLRSAEETMEESLPGSIQSIVLARVDSLDAPDKRALQAASVIGQRFALDALRHVIDDEQYSCTNLIAHFLVRPEGEDYLFTNALVRDGVYTSLLNARRQELHRRAAAWFVERDSILHAEHLDRADDPATAQAYLEAAQAQAAQYRYESTLRLAERGLEAAGDRPTRYAFGCLRGDMLRELGDNNRSIEAFEVALDVADDDAQKCRAWLGMAAGMRIVDRYDDALAALQRAEAAATKRNLATDLARIHYHRGNIYFPLGNFDGCLEQHALAREYARQAGSPEYEAQALGGLGDAYFVGGRMITAHDHFQRCIEVCRQNRLRRIEIANLHMLGETRLYKNELQSALDDCVAAAEPAAEIGHHRAELATRCVMAYLLYDMGRLPDAEQQCEQALIIARRLGARRFEALAHIYMGQILASKGRMSESIECVEKAIAIGRESGITYSGPWALGVLAMITRDPAQRRRALKEGEQILRQECVSHNYFWFYRTAMEVCIDSGEWEEVERFAAALEAYTRPEPLPWSDFFITRGRILAAFGRGQCDDVTMQELKRLHDEAERVGFKTALPALEEALATV
jgi:class 3 adenylate cyclase/tetratricopeptide (TPR) repeat protein